MPPSFDLPSFRVRSLAMPLAAAAVAVVVYALLAYVLFGEAAPLRVVLIGAVNALAVGGAAAVLQRRAETAADGLRQELEGKERECQRLNSELEERVRKRTAQLRLAASVVENTSEGVMVVDEGGVILSVNPAFTEITGYGAGEAVGKTPRLLRSDYHDEAFFKSLWETLAATGRWQGEIWNRRKAGELYPQWLTINRISGGEGIKTCYVGLFSDGSERREKEERVRHLAFHDPLTGLPNRSLLFDRLQHALLKADREKRRVAVLFIDLNRFKAINDRLGHHVGDLLLQEVAKRLLTCLRGTDTISRLGGDEFVVVLEDLDGPEDAASVASNLGSVISLPLELAGYEVKVGAAIGIALYPEDGGAADLMKAADTAMYAAKEIGGGAFRFFHAGMTEQASRRLQLEEDISRAVREGELEMHYQPRVRLDTRQPCGVEALVRWRHPRRGLVPAGEFIPLAEETGAIGPLSEWVLGQSFRQLADWRRHGIDTPIAVNLSGRQLRQEDLADRLTSLALEHEVPLSSFQVDVAEKVLMDDPESHGKALGRLREIGVKVTVDNYGTGHASLADLRRLPVDGIRVDRSVVLAALEGGAGVRMVQATAAMAQIMGLGLEAEGVESREEVEILAAVGFPAAQGFYFARPEAADVTQVWLATRALSQS